MAILGHTAFGEPVKISQAIGLALIVIGVAFVAYAAEHALTAPSPVPPVPEISGLPEPEPG